MIGTSRAIRFRDATAADIPKLAALSNSVAGALTARFGEGHWSLLVSERGVAASMRHSRVRVGRIGTQIVTALRLANKKPWAIDIAYFTPVKRAVYLTGMSVAVARQGSGLGRAALVDALEVARQWPADAVRLDAYDAEAGAVGFYSACGFTERGHVNYKGTALVYFEYLL